MKGLTLRNLVLGSADTVERWGRVPLLLIMPGGNELTAPFLFDTPTGQATIETSEFKTGIAAEDLTAHCLPDALVVPVRKSHRNSFSDVIIGRATNCDIRFTDPSVSKVHAYMRPPSDALGVWVLWEPAPSTNGTFVDGIRLDPFPAPKDATARATTAHVFQVAPGRKLRFGSVQCLFLDPEGLAQTLEYAVELWTANGLDWHNRPEARSDHGGDDD